MSAHRRRGVRVGPVGLVVRPRALVLTLVLAAVVAALGAYSVLAGTTDVPADRVWAALSGAGTRIEELVVLDHRFGRAGVALLVGVMLGVAGALTQSITRNPIASPDILGVTAGAGAAATLLIVLPDVVPADSGYRAAQLLVPAALLGATLTTLLILALAWRGGFDGLRLVLVGIAVNALALAVTTYLLTRADSTTASIATRWLIGSVADGRYDDLVVLAPVALAGLLAALVLGRDVGALRLGREVAVSLGTPAGRTEGAALVLAVVLTAAATAVAGPIGFVAFVAPQAALRLFGTAGPPLLASGLVGGALLLAADVVAQRLPGSLPVGIVTAVVGAPVLLYLVTRSTRRTSV